MIKNWLIVITLLVSILNSCAIGLLASTVQVITNRTIALEDMLQIILEWKRESYK